MPALQRAQEDRRGDPRLADTRRPNEDDVAPLGDEVELGELPHDGLGDAGLPGEGEGVERPPFGHLRALDAGLDAVLALVIKLLAQETREEVAVARVGLLGAGELARDDGPRPRQLETREQLIQLVVVTRHHHLRRG
ncbi:MAG: hypothetical protein Q8S73_11225 [Deltaproteobacteria bacterium]|nr:hypothetical protein [Deltaproteobacteria bacterium]